MRHKTCISLLISALLLCFILPVQAQTSPPATAPPIILSDTSTPAPAVWILGSGLGFKPYQTSIKDGSSGFIEAGVSNGVLGTYTFGRVVFHPTYAEFVAEECKAVYSRGRWSFMGCGDIGIGATSDNAAGIFGGGGKLFFQVGKPDRDGNLTLVGVEMGVTKSTVPTVVAGSGIVNPVQPDLRVGIHRTFN